MQLTLNREDTMNRIVAMAVSSLVVAGAMVGGAQDATSTRNDTVSNFQ